MAEGHAQVFGDALVKAKSAIWKSRLQDDQRQPGKVFGSLCGLGVLCG